MRHRGDQTKARDLFDLCAVADFEPLAIGPHFPSCNGAAFLHRLEQRAEVVGRERGLIEARSFRKPLCECLAIAHSILEPLA